MSIKSYLAGIVRAVLPFAVAEVETLVKTEVDRFVPPTIAIKIETAVDTEVETLVKRFGPHTDDPPPGAHE